MKAAFAPYTLVFRQPAVTSRQTMLTKLTYYIKVWDDTDPSRPFGIGECGLFRGLSYDDRPGYEDKLDEVCRAIAAGTPLPDLCGWPSICFGVEAALDSWRLGLSPWTINGSGWVDGRVAIPINGLIWMGGHEEMIRRIDSKLDAGFRCIKIKVGAIRFDDEVDLLRYLRRRYSPADLTLRLDANGGFSSADALERLKRLSDFTVHSIEQPIRQGCYEEMARLCELSPIDIALDEELIGLTTVESRKRMLDTVRPQYIILKPSLCGGISATVEWKRLADERGIGSWLTSALESDVGLNVIAQTAAALYPRDVIQGLGTGALFTNNFSSPLRLENCRLTVDPGAGWTIPDMEWNIR